MPTVMEYVDAHRESSMNELQDLLRIPSVSTDPDHKGDVRACASFVADRMREVGLETSIHETDGHPIVYGERLNAPGRPTLLIYGHYDVQPPDPLELWRHGPFTPTVEGEFLVARGATDDKGQFYALLKGVQAALEVHGELPINVKVIIEGEEEIGSPNLVPFIQENRDRLACDVVVVSDCSQFAKDVPAITYGLKGLCYMQVTAHGPAIDLHSGAFGGAVPNPANALARLLTQCQDADGRVLIGGFYEDVRPIADWERKAFAELDFDEARFLEETGAAMATGEPGYSTLERKWGRPTLDVNGLLSGFTGEGAKTVLPARAMAKFSMRLVPDQKWEDIRDLTVRHLERLAPDAIRLEIECFHGADPVIVDRDTPYVKASVRAMAGAFGREPVFIREGGSIPVVGTFKTELGVDTLLLGLGLPTDGAHSPNEQFRIIDYYRGQAMMANLLAELAEV